MNSFNASDLTPEFIQFMLSKMSPELFEACCRRLHPNNYEKFRAELDRYIPASFYTKNYEQFHPVFERFELSRDTPAFIENTLSPDMLQFYGNLIDQEPFDIPDEREFYPIICLQKTSTGLDKDKQLRDLTVLVSHPILKLYLTILVPDINGIYIYRYKHRFPSKIKSAKREYTDAQELNVAFYKNGLIGDILQYMKKHNKDGIFSHIVIISGYEVGQENISSTDGEWRPTHEIVSKN
jgi:hypothetical protein